MRSLTFIITWMLPGNRTDCICQNLLEKCLSLSKSQPGLSRAHWPLQQVWQNAGTTPAQPGASCKLCVLNIWVPAKWSTALAWTHVGRNFAPQWWVTALMLLIFPLQSVGNGRTQWFRQCSSRRQDCTLLHFEKQWHVLSPCFPFIFPSFFWGGREGENGRFPQWKVIAQSNRFS